MLTKRTDKRYIDCHAFLILHEAGTMDSDVCHGCGQTWATMWAETYWFLSILISDDDWLDYNSWQSVGNNAVMRRAWLYSHLPFWFFLIT